MSSPRSIEVKVGILIMTAVTLLALFILVMGGLNFQPTYALNVDFDNPGGLQTGAPVKIAGVKVGKIVDIQFRGGEAKPTPGKREALVRMAVKVERRYMSSIHENSIFYVTTQGVLGEQFLAIEPGSADRPVLAEGSSIRGLDPPRLDMLLSESYELLHSAVSAVRENRAEFAEAFEGLRQTLKGTGGFFDRNGQKIDRITSNVEQLTTDAQGILKKAGDKYVDNPQIDRILANADHVAIAAAKDVPPLLADGRETVASAKRIASSVGSEAELAKIKALVTDASDLVKMAKSATADAQVLISHVKRGKGTVGALVMDEQLYDDLQEMARDLKHNPWKFFWKE
jgi:phospholipid/cholesterol/gamma-HCH transport system substrate-binding protein